MSIKNHVVSLELAKKLKEAGWKKPTFYWVVKYKNGNSEPILAIDALIKLKKIVEDDYEVYPAPLATEILEELPCNNVLHPEFTPERLSNDGYIIIPSKRKMVSLHIYKTADSSYGVEYCNEIGDKHGTTTGGTLPDALAQMWLYLKQEKFI